MHAAQSAKHRMMLAAKDARAVRDGALMLRSRGERDVRRRVARGMVLPSMGARRRAPGSVWAVAMVKNEADIIGQTLDHLLEQGVDGILVADNGSTDGTLDVLHSRVDGGRVFIGVDREPAYFQAPKMRHLARWAARAGADWIVPFDADEWWYAHTGTLANSLRTAPAQIASAVIHNAFPSPVGSGSAWRVDVTPARLEKVAYRHSWSAALHHGNHGVTRPGRVTQSLRILHFPWRSEEHFHGKIRTGASAIALTGPRAAGGGADHWRELGEATPEELDQVWRRLTTGAGDPRLEWQPQGSLVPLELREWSRWWDPRGVLS